MVSSRSLKDRSPHWVRQAARGLTRGAGMATASRRGVPDYFVIGAKRGGTTSLFRYLRMHPGVLGLFPRSRETKSTDYFFGGAPKGETWYRSHFYPETVMARHTRRLGYRPVVGEASPYYVWDPRIAPLARAVNPEARAIMLVRDPVERAFSHWQERVQNGVEPLSFPDALDAEASRTAGELERMGADPSYHGEAHDWYSYRARGIYRPQLENWCTAFPREQLLVVRSEDMYADVQGTFDTVCDFLGIARHALPTTERFNASRRPDLPAATGAELYDYYAPFNADLAQWLGRPLGWAAPPA
ncbi:sulfotransferase [Nocardioides dongxiaopingii]|uniref:sulfotransferase family protein n=1 Tax=Nocardioides sp. S-1144 TaxID=2582905 RepID=UPI00110E1391|nr:sulfotransferase [Nocardioides sp. S-1144]QCW51435.1 sulfotransferase [Nocardioides sp. S-1144]